VIDKPGLRATISAARARLTEAEREQARERVRQHVLAWCAATELPAGSLVAGYLPLRTEPGSLQLLADLDQAGYRVIVPLTLPDRDLDWLAWTGDQPPGGDRPDEPLGLLAISRAALVLVPAFAADRHGHRLGRGGGSYDRALGRIRPDTMVAALLYQDELIDEVPSDAWDRPVAAAVTPAGWIELTPSGRRNT
jgi:5-formyltetrahydrofolate cyclo-ligase